MVKLEQLKELVLRAGDLLTDTVLSRDVIVKGDSDFVTRADLSVQEFMRGELAAMYPEAHFIAEENKVNDPGACGEAFILDPVDGTTNLMHDFCQSVISLGYYRDGRGIMGVMYNPFTKELFYAERGKGAFLGDKPIHCKNRAAMSECLAIVEFSPYYKENSAPVFEMMRQLFLKVHDIRSIGASAIDLVYLACGRADVFMSRDLKPWDYAAAQIILREAGGMTSDFGGRPLSLNSNSHVIAATAGVFAELAAFAKNFDDKEGR